MASNGQRPATTTTTSTSTSTFVSTGRRARAGSNTHRQTSSASSRIPLVVVSRDNVNSPRSSGNNNAASTEPFPNFSAEYPRSSQLSQVPTMDQHPLSPVTTTASQRIAPTPTSAQLRQRPIGIKRLSSQNVIPNTRNANPPQLNRVISDGRRRSTSAPQRPIVHEDTRDGAVLQHTFTTASNLGPLLEGQVAGSNLLPGTQDHENDAQRAPSRQKAGSQRLRRASDAARSAVSRLSNRSDEPEPASGEYSGGIVDVLDVLDPEVSTLTTLTNVQNSLFVPDLGRWLNRRPTYELTKGPSYSNQRPTLNRGSSKPLPATPIARALIAKENDFNVPSDIEEESESPSQDRRLSMVPSIASVVQEEHYAVLPHGVSLEGWSDEDKELLDDHVRHMLHSKREGFKRSMRAFGKYVRKPLGFFVTLYAVLITLFGLAWVLFLIGWIYVGEKQLYVINIIDNVLVALFAIMGDGMAPFRAVDTYHMSFVAYYHHLTEKIRKQRHLPELRNHNELPDVHESEVDVENAIKTDDFNFSVLTQEQQRKLEHHQNKFSNSHSFYKPHETTTHNAFPHPLFIAIVLLLDLHSCLQITLGSVTWSTNYRTRPKALTPTILSCSITVNITAGILIKVGDNKTRKKDVLERMFRQELTQEAMRRVDKTKEMRSANSKDQEEDQKGPEKTLSQERVKVQEETESNRFSSATVENAVEVPEKSGVWNV